MVDPDSEHTRFGFIWGNLHVERICVTRSGRFLYLATDKQSMEIRITPGGKLSIYSHDKKYKEKP